ncbi:hypothetical protein Acor_16630 [Acrocarpospora corrugata]|uniref:ABC transporter substrate-binding protein n=1 Tax=Acrocarpospora corrugata TaxID=35763 RepID=A0A5M3VUM9_9ACTN|nr:MlaD family protein [Acrocarpospora corrugata]GER99599.1 hypothetical protein Acor_16630 [Acrocarpospora corrugata]
MPRGGTLAKLGVFAVAALALLALIGGQIARVGFGSGYLISATFDDVSGLREGDEVKIAGAPVGQVETIEVVDGRAKVTMSFAAEVRVPDDTEAAVRWRDAIGQRVVYLLPGRSPRYLAEGAEITATASVVDIGQLIQDLGPLTRSLDPEQINQLLTAAAQALHGNQRNIPALVGNVDTLTTTIAARKKIIEGLLADYATVTGVIARRDEQIGDLVDNLVVLSDAFADNRALVDDALAEISATVATTDRILGANAGQLGRVVDRLAGLTSGVRRHVGEIESVMTTVQPLFRRAYQTTGRGRFLTTAVPCLALGPAPCPYGMRTPPLPRGNTKVTSANLRDLLVGQ